MAPSASTGGRQGTLLRLDIADAMSYSKQVSVAELQPKTPAWSQGEQGGMQCDAC